MFRFIALRILQFPLILAVIYLLTFFLVWVVPGSPFGQTERHIDPIAMAELMTRFHAQHWYTFLSYYPGHILLHGDFGPSMNYQGWSVNDILASGLPVSAQLGLLAVAIALIVGSAIGTLAAVRRGGVFDYLSLAVALIGISLPSFVAAGLILIFFSVKLRLLPIGGWGTTQQMIGPAIAISLMPLAYIARLTRVSMIDVLSSDYVRTARAKGLSDARVIWKHCFRNAFLPVFTYLGPAAAAALTGSFVVEKVFSVPGLGRDFVNSVLNRDRTLILGTVLVYSALLLLLNLIVDVGYAFIDPRIDILARSK
jgi:oligopeptide transport system permease protein